MALVLFLSFNLVKTLGLFVNVFTCDLDSTFYSDSFCKQSFSLARATIGRRCFSAASFSLFTSTKTMFNLKCLKLGVYCSHFPETYHHNNIRKRTVFSLCHYVVMMFAQLVDINNIVFNIVNDKAIVNSICLK